MKLYLLKLKLVWLNFRLFIIPLTSILSSCTTAFNIVVRLSRKGYSNEDICRIAIRLDRYRIYVITKTNRELKLEFYNKTGILL